MHRRQRRATNLNLPGKVKTGAPGASQSGSLYVQVSYSSVAVPELSVAVRPWGKWGQLPHSAVEAGAG